MNVTDFFSSTVTEAEQKFVAACEDAGVKTELIPYPAPGPAGEVLHVGVCRVGSETAEKILLVVSATHGVEGYAGAGIQTGLIKNTDLLELDANTALVMVHMINPWGAAWNRRETEDNVDLFRNFHYCDKPAVPDPLYDEIDDAMDLEHWPGRSPEQKRKVERELFSKYGSERVIAAIRRGQHHRPKGMTFHGNGPTWNKLTLDAIARRYLNNAMRVTVMDIHTGFGEYGKGMIIVYDEPGSKKYRCISSWMKGEIYTPGNDADTPPHAISPYDFIEIVVPGTEVTGAVLEYGTYDPEETREVFPANAHYHLYGDPLSKEGLETGAIYRRYCYPDNDDWKEQVWNRGLEVTRLLLKGMKQWSDEACAVHS